MELPRLCIDTGPLIGYLKGREPDATVVERAVRERDCRVTVITVYELLFGVARAKKHIGEDALLGAMTVVPIDDTAAREAARLHSDLIDANNEIGIKDTLIAAVCLAQSLSLPPSMTGTSHACVPGLTVLTPASYAAP